MFAKQDQTLNPGSGNTKRFLIFESSCDDTSVALMEAVDGDHYPRLVSWAVQSQNEVHERFGGVVPELASREHLRNLLPCVEKVLSEGGIALEDIDIFAATSEPGLVGCLLIGQTAAKTLAMIYEKPLITCHHIESHLMSVFLESSARDNLKFPFVSLVVSGGHTSLYLIESEDSWTQLGETLDDAAGEAFDKGAKLLGLEFPGGAAIDREAVNGDPKAYALGKVELKDPRDELNFSFSGLKSDFARLVNRIPTADRSVPDLSAAYQSALLDHLLGVVRRALRKTGSKSLAIVGGVARNRELRKRLELLQQAGELDRWFAPAPEFCTDNAAMVGVLAFRKWQRGQISDLSADVRSTGRISRRNVSP